MCQRALTLLKRPLNLLVGRFAQSGGRWTRIAVTRWQVTRTFLPLRRHRAYRWQIQRDRAYRWQIWQDKAAVAARWETACIDTPATSESQVQGSRIKVHVQMKVHIGQVSKKDGTIPASIACALCSTQVTIQVSKVSYTRFFTPKQGLEKVLNTCSLNLPHWHIDINNFLLTPILFVK
jgi:hypothetical protein